VKVEVYVWAMEKYYLKTSHSKLYGYYMCVCWDGVQHWVIRTLHEHDITTAHVCRSRCLMQTCEGCRQIICGALYCNFAQRASFSFNCRKCSSHDAIITWLACLHLHGLMLPRVDSTLLKSSKIQTKTRVRPPTRDVIFLIWGRNAFRIIHNQS
jgi:hypothetical protein